jgi:iron complex outermembrane receptor protein
MRLSYQHYRYRGNYPYDYGEAHPVISEDGAASHTLTADLSARRRFARIHMFTFGTEVRGRLHNHQWSGDQVYGQTLDVEANGSHYGFFAQDEIRVRPWLLLSAGGRLDRSATLGSRFSPRGAVVLLPRRQTSVKVLHGRAFRAPNPYELFYYAPMREGGFELSPETVRSTEVIWEEQFSPMVRMSLTGFHYDVEDLIEQRGIVWNEVDDLYFTNLGSVRGHGVEGEIEARLPSGVVGRISQTIGRTRNLESGTQMSNAPHLVSKVAAQIPLHGFHVGVEGQYVGERLALTGEPIDGHFVSSVILTSPVNRRFEASVGVHNLFDAAYADPAAEEHVQREIPQDGRTLLAKVSVRF